MSELSELVLKHGTDMKDIGFTEGFYKGHRLGVRLEREGLYQAMMAGVISEETYDAINAFKNAQL